MKALRILPTPTPRLNAPDLYSHVRWLMISWSWSVLTLITPWLQIILKVMTMTMTTFPSDLWWLSATLRAREPPLCQSPLFLFSPGSRLAKLPFDFYFAIEQVLYSQFGIFFVSIRPREKSKKVAIRLLSDNIHLFFIHISMFCLHPQNTYSQATYPRR